MILSKKTSTAVGIDVSKSSLDIAYIDTESGEIKTKKCKNISESIYKLYEWMKKVGVSKDTPIIVESTASYHWLVCLILSEQSLSVKLINPLITKKYQKSSIRNTKTDAVDAMRLAEIGLIEENLPNFIQTRGQLAHKKYHSLYAKLKKTKQQLEKAYKDAIAAVKEIGLDIEKDIEPIQGCIKQMKEAIQSLERIITKNASGLAKEIGEIRGISLFQACILSEAVEGRSFGNKEQITAFFGLDVRQMQSGKWIGRQKISKRGNAFYRKILFQIGWGLQRNNPEYHEYYEKLYKEKGKHYYTAIIATARRFLHYFFKKLSASY